MKSKKRKAVTPDWKLKYLKTGDFPPTVERSLDAWCFRYNHGDVQTLAWQENREQILAAWIRQRPGSRPWAWWEYDSPRDKELCAGTAWAGKFPLARKKIGGKGAPLFEIYNFVPRFSFGVPIDFYIRKMGIKDKPGEKYDPENPPIYESEASYLDRLGLLAKGEKKRIKPEQFEPVTILPNGTTKRRSALPQMRRQSSSEN